MSEITEIRVGDKLRDQDPRTSHRQHLTITAILPTGVRAITGRGQSVTIRRRSIYTDGKPRRTGFCLLRDPE